MERWACMSSPGSTRALVNMTLYASSSRINENQTAFTSVRGWLLLLLLLLYSCGEDTGKVRLSPCALVESKTGMSPSRVAIILDERHQSTLMDYMPHATVGRYKTVLSDRSWDDEGC